MHSVKPIPMLLAALALSVAAACDDSPPPKNPFDPPPKDYKEPPPIKEAPKPKGPPQLIIGSDGPKVGWTTVAVGKKDSQAKLRKEIEANKDYFGDQPTSIAVDRKAKLEWVISMIQELARVGSPKITIKTETRDEFPKQLKFTPQSRVKNPAGCSIVTMVLKDRGTAVWTVAGGRAAKRAKGLAGPDLSTTAETLERYIKKCESSHTMFVSAQEGIEWGLAYDLAASAQKAKGANFKVVVVLEQEPVPGREVEL